MKKMMGAALVAACLGLAACGAGGKIAGTPAVTRQVTEVTYDAVGSADIAYLAANRLGAAAVQSGQLSGDRYRELDARAYAALIQVRSVAGMVRLGTATVADLQPASAALLRATAAFSEEK